MTVTIENTYTGNGSTTDYSFTFPYLDTTDIKASLGGIVTTAFSLTNATTVRFNSAPGNGVAIRIYRETAYENPKATFYPGSAIRAGDLNDNTLQNLYVTQEANDKVANSWQTGDQTIISTETWHTSDDTKIATTKAIENRINSQIDSALTDDVIAGSSITIADNTPSAGKITVSVPAASGSVAGTMSASDFSKLAGIDTGAKDDQTAAEIRALVESATDSNVFTDADHTKLNNIETAATADQTNAEIRAAVEAASDSNVFTDADHTKLNGIETAATADQTAAEIKTAYESNAETNALTDAEKLVIDGVTANTSELNKLDGVTASTTELNIVAGKSFKTSSGTLDTTSDTEIPSSKVIAAHVASSQTAIGGFITIADEVSFPATASMPANGVVVSINNAAGVVVNSSGVSTTGRTTDGTPATVTINNFPSSLNGETLSAGVGLIVTATSTSNTYNYHKILVAESDVKQLSDDINDFNSRYRIASSAPGSNNDEGDLYFDTGANKMKVYNGSSWDDVASVGSFFINTISSSSNTGGGSATFNGSAYRFTLSNPGTAAQQHVVSINGVIQKPNSGTSQPSEGFAIDGNDIIFSAAPASGADYFIITQGSSVSIGTPSANSVNSSHIIDGSITNADISNSAAIAQSKIAIGGANGLDFSDGTIVKFGTDSDMYIYHENTSHTTRFHAYNDRVIDIGYNQTSSGLKKSFIQCYPNTGQVNISHGGTSKFSTTATGISVTGDVVLSEDIELGNDKNINLGTAFSARHFTSDPSGSGWITGDQNAFYSNTAKPFRFYNYISGSTTWQPHISMNPSGNVELFHSGSKKLETTSYGISVDGTIAPTNHVNLVDNSKAQFGTGYDLQIYHDGSNSYINNSTGALYLRTGTGLNLQNAAGTETYLYATENGAVFLKHDNVTKLETTSGGVEITGALTVNGAAVGGGATFEATTNGAVSEGDPLLVESDGKVRKVNQLSAGTGSKTDINTTLTGNTEPQHEGNPVLYEPVSGTTYVFYNYASSYTEYLYYKRATVSGTTVTYSSGSSTGLWNTNGNTGFKAVAAGTEGNAAGKIAILGHTGSSSSGTRGPLMFRVGTPNGNTISWDFSAVQASVDGNGSNIDASQGTYDVVYCPKSDRWVICYRSYHSSAGYRTLMVQVFDSSGNRKSSGSGTEFQQENGSSGWVENARLLYDKKQEKVVIFATCSLGSTSSYQLVFRAGDVSATSVTWNGTLISGSGYDAYNAWPYTTFAKLNWDAGNMVNNPRFHVKYHDASGEFFIAAVASTNYYYLQMKRMKLDSDGAGKTITDCGYTGTGTYVGGNSGRMNGFKTMDFCLNESGSKIYWVFQMEGNAYGNESQQYNEIWSGSADLQTDGTIGSGSNFYNDGWTALWQHNDSSDISSQPTCAAIGMGKVLVTWTYKNNSDSNYSNYDRLSIVRQEVASDLIDKYVGIADANYADGATATVLCAGNVSDKHSSLSPGSKYYVSATGTLSTAKANPEVFAGTAVSATTITVKN